MSHFDLFSVDGPRGGSRQSPRLTLVRSVALCRYMRSVGSFYRGPGRHGSRSSGGNREASLPDNHASLLQQLGRITPPAG
jgi:hypothetical protein